MLLQRSPKKKRKIREQTVNKRPSQGNTMERKETWAEQEPYNIDWDHGDQR